MNKKQRDAMFLLLDVADELQELGEEEMARTIRKVFNIVLPPRRKDKDEKK